MGDGFKHIAVTAPEEDEVIVAGEAGAPEPAADSAPEPARQQGASGAHGQPSRASADDGYHETSLSDLEGEKMPLTQRIVIVAAIICIIGALVYYFVAMR